MADKKNNSAKSRKQIELAVRRRKVIRLWRTGLMQYEIAVELGVNVATVSRDLKFIREGWEKEASKDFAEHRQQELSKLDDDENDLRNEIRKDENIKLRARLAIQDRIMKIQERRAKLLGLDGPDKLALTDPTGKHSVLEPLSPAQVRAAVEAMNRTEDEE